MARWYKLRSIGWHPSPTKRKSHFPSRHCLKWNVGTHFFHLCASRPTTSGRAPLSHPTSSIPGDHIYGRIDRQRAAFLFEFLQLAIELPPPPLPFLFSHKSSEKQPFYADRRRRQLCSLPRSLTHLMLFPYLLLAREKKERIGERREYAATDFYGAKFRAAGRIERGQITAKNWRSPLLPLSFTYPLLSSSSPNDDWQAVRARQLLARSA